MTRRGRRGLAPLDDSVCGVRNLDAGTADDRVTIAATMNATAALSQRLQKNPVCHFSVNWVDGEHPTREVELD